MEISFFITVISVAGLAMVWFCLSESDDSDSLDGDRRQALRK